MTRDVRFEQVNMGNQYAEGAKAKKTPKAPAVVPVGQSGNYEDGNNITENYAVKDYTKLTQEEKINLILKITNISKEDYDRLNNQEKEFYEKCLDSAIKYLIKNGKELSFETISQKTKEYTLARLTGWGSTNSDGSYNFDIYEQRQKDKRGLGERLAQFSKEIKEKGFANVSREEQERAIKAFFNDFFRDIEKKGKNHEYIVKSQLQTFGRILINSSEEERVMFNAVIKQLLAENVSPGLKAVLESLEKLDDKQRFANSFTHEDRRELAAPDRYGNTMTREDTEVVSAYLARYQSTEIIERNHTDFENDLTEFLEKNKSLLKSAHDKNYKDLTEEEQKAVDELSNFYEATAAGEAVGTASNTLIETESRNNLLSQFNYDSYSHGEDYYRNVMSEISKLAESHPEILSMGAEEFTSLMNSITDNNYSTVVNNTGESLVVPTKPETQNSASPATEQSSSLPTETGNNSVSTQTNGYNNSNYTESEINEKKETINEIKSNLQKNERTNSADNLSVERLQTNKGYEESVQEHGLIPTIKFVFRYYDKVAASVANAAADGFKILSNDMQAGLIQNAGGKGLREMLKNVSSMAVLNKIKSKQMNNLADVDVVEEKKQKQKELMGE